MQPCLALLPRAWMLIGAGEGAREWGPHLRRSSPTPGDCGPPPPMTHSRPSSDEHATSFPVGSRVTYTCIQGTVKIPERSDTVECLPGARWSKLPEPCSRSCAPPTRLRFAALTKEDERINFFPVGTNVSYVCRPGYENTSESSLTSTCLENLAWSEVAELCRSEYLLGRAAVELGFLDSYAHFSFFHVFSLRYKLNGSNFIYCQLKGNNVEWSKLPTCELITCSSPPQISKGKHDGEGVEKFTYNSTVTYICEPGFQLLGNASIRCTSGDKTKGVWSGAAPECKGRFFPFWQFPPNIPNPVTGLTSLFQVGGGELRFLRTTTPQPFCRISDTAQLCHNPFDSVFPQPHVSVCPSNADLLP
uniref:Sushi domain-containing protein n=1 Tax=Calidris pygmaea TaxID=425635 RepID=A0A8C3KR39_9CHAR